MHRDNRCVGIWRMFVLMSVVGTVWVCGHVCCVATVINDSWGFEPWSVEVCLCRGCDGCCVFSSDRGIKSQGNLIKIRDLTQECRKNL